MLGLAVALVLPDEEELYWLFLLGSLVDWFVTLDFPFVIGTLLTPVYGSSIMHEVLSHTSDLHMENFAVVRHL